MTLFQFWQVPQLVPVSPRGGGKAIPLSKMKKSTSDKNSDDYRQRRERNNLAVKKSRMRSKQKAQDTQQRVNELKEENERLEAKIKLLSKELSVLKDLFLEHAHNLADNVQPPTSSGGPGDLCNNNNNNNSSQWGPDVALQYALLWAVWRFSRQIILLNRVMLFFPLLFLECVLSAVFNLCIFSLYAQIRFPFPLVLYLMQNVRITIVTAESSTHALIWCAGDNFNICLPFVKQHVSVCWNFAVSWRTVKAPQ